MTRLTLSLLAALGAAIPAAAGELSVGFGESDITPALGKAPVFLAGFGQNRLAKSVHDPLFARAVVLADDGTDKVALVSVDVVGLFHPFVESMRAKLPGFKYVLVSATHNHEGPDTLGLWGPNPLQSGVDRDYLAKVQAECVEAVLAADKARRPAAAKIGTARAPELIRDTRLPEVKHDELVALKFFTPKEKAVGVVVQWNCHPEVLDDKNTAVTADFVGYTVAHLRKAHGCPVVYLTGTVGGLMTTLRLPVKDEAGKDLADGTFEKAERYGTLVGKVADSALAKATPLALTPFDVRRREVLLPMDNPVYRLASQLGTLKRPVYLWEGSPTPKAMTPAPDLSKPVAVKTEVGYLKLGELEVATIPGEIYPELVLGKVVTPAEPGADFPDAPAEPALYEQLRGKHRMIVGLANDELGYFVPKRQWDEKAPFCYGRRSAQYGEVNSVGPETAPILCETFRRLVRGE